MNNVTGKKVKIENMLIVCIENANKLLRWLWINIWIHQNNKKNVNKFRHFIKRKNKAKTKWPLRKQRQFWTCKNQHKSVITDTSTWITVANSFLVFVFLFWHLLLMLFWINYCINVAWYRGYLWHCWGKEAHVEESDIQLIYIVGSSP